MAYRDFLPSREGEFVAWSTNFNTRITATPTAFGLVAAQATAYAALQAAFITQYNVTSNRETRSGAAVIAKDQAKAALVRSARQLAGIIQKYPATTDEQRALLGLTVAKQRSPIQAPTVPPVLEVEKVDQRDVTVRVRALNSTRRGKPKDVAGVTFFSYIGDLAPENINDWKFEGNVATTKVVIDFPDAQPFARVWLTAFWRTARGLSSPACAPISTNLGTWMVQSERTDTAGLKKAA
jgi:hypothetical protein